MLLPKILIIFLLLITLKIFWESQSTEVTWVKSNFDGNEYLVKNLPDKDSSADHLAMIRAKLNLLIKHLKKKYKKDPRVKRLCENFQDDVISETPSNNKYTSYTVNKGEKIYLCLRQRDENNQLVDLNTITFVALHELAHIMTKTIDHTPEFWNNFRFLLKETIKLGLYKYQPFHKRPVKYCGTLISDTPLKNKWWRRKV